MIPRGFLFACLAIVSVIAVGLLALLSSQQYSPYSRRQVGGAFNLVEMTGRRVTEKNLLGKPTAISFGYTNCPDVCPTTLLMLSNAMEKMGADANRLNVVFVTIDPQRDTQEQMRTYLSSFDPRIRGFTGTEAEVGTVANAYHIYYRRVSTSGGDYTMDHSAGVYLFDGKGRLVGQIPFDDTADRAYEKLNTLISPDACIPNSPPHVDLWSGAADGKCAS